MKRLSRRSILGGISAGAAALVAAPAMRAQADGPPARLVILYQPNGVLLDQWHVAQTGTEYALSPMLQPFAPLKDDMIIMKGLHLGYMGGGEHRGGIVQQMSGWPWVDENLAGGSATAPSIDQILAKQSPLLNQATIPSLQLGADHRTERDGELASRSLSWSGAYSPLPMETDVLKAYANVFGPLANPNGSQQSVERLLARQQSVLDFLKDDLAQLRTRVPATEFAKMDSHLDAIRQFEGTLATQANAQAECRQIATPDQNGLTPNVDENYERVFDAQLDLIKTILQCDISRVVTMMASGTTSVMSFAKAGYLPLQKDGGIHAITHAGALSNGDWPQVVDWYYRKFANFLLSLKETPEGNGTMLDNTVVVVFSEVGEDQKTTDLPFAVFGGRALGLQLGQSLAFEDRRTNDFWRTLAEVFGVDGDLFGDRSIGSGRLSGLT